MSIDKVFPEELQDLTRNLGEDNYTLVDVRQPHEYLEGHIPGARLIPLPELESGLEELRRRPNLIFYCRSGARSLVAANWAEEHLGSDIRVANMVGGFTAWEGKELRAMPRLRVFGPAENMAQALIRAMDLEKGAQGFYLNVAAKADDAAPGLAAALHTLADVELAHARVLHHRLRRMEDQHGSASDQSFEERYAALPGDILEGGMSLHEALDRVSASSPHFCIEVTDLALEIELMAYDLYRNLAASAGSDMEDMLLRLARDELSHQRLLVRQLPHCPE